MRSIVSLVLIILSFGPASSQDDRFPYKARVVAAEAYVRSGNGEAFYPTQKLERDSIVTVRRHDPAGWYMIDPPANSFSWIPVRHVSPGPNGTGSVNENDVVVYVGSEFGDDIHVWQRKLMAGETVRIIEQRSVDTVSGPKQMFRIKPPKREFRWIPGKALVPVENGERQRRDSNPYQVPSELAEQGMQTPRQPTVAADQPTVLSDGSRYSPNQGMIRLKKIREEQRALQAIDQKFRNMILQDPSQWKLSEIEQEYLKLQNSATHKPLSGQIDLRYPAINHYRQRKAQLDSFNQLTSATEQRDQQLLAMQFGVPQAGLPLPANPQTGPITASSGPSSANASLTIPGLTIPRASSTPVAEGSSKPEGVVAADTSLPFAEIPDSVQQFSVAQADSVSTLPGLTESFGQSTQTFGAPGSPQKSQGDSNRFIGAGVLQKSVGPNGPQYVLTNQTGRVLAHVTAQANVALDQHLGRSIGVRGKRWFDPQLKSDRIQVSELETVRLVQ